MNNNGHITFGAPFSAWNPRRFPLNFGSPGPLIAPYWADVDTRPTGSGTVFYRETQDPLLLQRAQSELQMAFPGLSSFNPVFLFIATWYRVGHYDRRINLVNPLCS